MSRKFQALSGRDQILKRPQMWIGSMDTLTREMFIINEDSIERKEIGFIPAFKKIIDEILDNSLDVLIETRNATGNIKVKITEESVYIEDDGPGIPVIKHKLSDEEKKSLPAEEAEKIANSYIPEIAWTRLFSGSNFNDSDDKHTIGAHGLGSKCTSIFSTKFVGKTDDGKKSCVVKSLNNLEVTSCKTSHSSGKTGTTVEFYPDLSRFKMKKIDQVYFDLLYQRLLCLSITFPNIKFTFNGKRISVNDKKFLKMFSENIETFVFDKGFIGVFPNESDEFSFFTYVNGIHLNRGGNHIDYISQQLVAPIRTKLERKYKTIKPADIKNRLSIVCFFRDFANPKFDSQTKETLTNSPSEISNYLSDSINFEDAAKKILKNESIINPIVDTFKIKEELKSRQELRAAKKIKIKSDKYLSSTGDKKYLLLVEGLSARAGLSGALGRNGFAYYAGRGVPLNAYDATTQKITSNEELKDIVNILELDLFSKDSNKTISFDKIVIATDADIDGDFITSQYIGWFVKFAPNLFNERKIAKLRTPLVILKDNKNKPVKYFYSLNEFKEFETSNNLSKYKIEYLKGLGSWDKDAFIKLFDENGFEYYLQDLQLDELGKQYVNDWLSGKEAEKRKQYLRDYTLNIELM